MNPILVRMLFPIFITLGLVGGGAVVLDRQSEKTETTSSAHEHTTTSVDSHSHNHTYSIDLTAIPLGDGKVSTSPKVGYVYSCQTNFRGGGASHSGDWIEGDTWDLTKKVSVDGSVSWPSAVFSVTIKGNSLDLIGNGLPINHNTGSFPISRSDDAYQYDTNPNDITEQIVDYSLPANPSIANDPSCVPMGPVGFALNGVAIYNALDDAGRDAVAHETQDECSGHPQGGGQYHYHGPSDCMLHADENNALVGYALDGFGIYSRFDANGVEYTNEDLDECHGITSEIEWSGEMVNMYHYVLTAEYPYTVGCFRGTPVETKMGMGATNANGQRNTNMQTNQAGGPSAVPPAEATNACVQYSSGSSCSFTTLSGVKITGSCRTTPDSSNLACVPN